MVESSALLKRRGPKGLRGFESPPHREIDAVDSIIHPGDENPSFERRSRHSSKRRRGRAGVRLRKAQPEGQGLGRGRSQSPLTENAPQPHQISSRGMRISFDHPRDSAPPREQREPHPWSLAPRGNPPSPVLQDSSSKARAGIGVPALPNQWLGRRSAAVRRV